MRDLRPLSARSAALSLLLGAEPPELRGADLVRLGEAFGISGPTMRVALSRLVAAGELEPVDVECFDKPAWRHVDAKSPRRVEAAALLSPFDSLIWQRERTESLWGFRYRLEIYTPADRRVHGYYVLPFLLGEELVGRVDLKADRAAGALLARQITWEPRRGGADDRRELAEELAQMATWLGLGEVVGA